MGDKFTYITIFSDVVPSTYSGVHTGPVIGKPCEKGFNYTQLVQGSEWFKKKGCCTRLLDLTKLTTQKCPESAYALVVKKGLQYLLPEGSEPNTLYHELAELSMDTRVVVKNQLIERTDRHRVCCGMSAQYPNFREDRGTVHPFSSVPIIDHIQETLPDVFGVRAKDTVCETDYYFDTSKCCLPYHGNPERCKYIALCTGHGIQVHMGWFLGEKKIGTRIEIVLTHGDLLILSEKAIGSDWTRSDILTLRHAFGSTEVLGIGGIPVKVT